MIAILSQNKKWLFPFNQPIWVNEEDLWIGTQVLATYATEERALEVFKEIQVAVMGRIIIPMSINGEQCYVDDLVYRQKGTILGDNIQVLPLVYEMPQE